MESLNQKDTPQASANRIVLTQDQLMIPGIRSFGWQRDSKANSPLPDHFHENALELTFILDGSYTFRIGNANYSLGGGELFIAYPDEVHSTGQLPMSVGEIYWIQLELSRLENFLFLSREASSSLIRRFCRFGQHVLPTRKKEILSLLSRAFSCALSGEENERYLCAALLAACLNLLCCEMCEKSDNRLSCLTPDMEAALHYIHANLREALTLEEVAAVSGLSLSQFKQKFRQQTGASPRDYINRKKIDLSAQLLLAGKSKTEVAMELNFNTSSYFASVFRKYHSCTPSEYVARKKKGTR